jgi:hypothetical protein
MHHRLPSLAALVLAAGAVTACDGRGTTGPGTPLTQADATALSRAVYAAGASFAGGAVPGGARGNQTVLADGSTTFSFSFDSSKPCVPSGSIGVAGALSGAVTGQSAEVQVNVTLKHAACVVRTDGGSFTLTGDPGIAVALNARVDAARLSGLHATETGAFTWERGSGSSGRCVVDLAADLLPGTANVRLSGSFCGFSVDQTVPVEG